MQVAWRPSREILHETRLSVAETAQAYVDRLWGCWPAPSPLCFSLPSPLLDLTVERAPWTESWRERPRPSVLLARLGLCPVGSSCLAWMRLGSRRSPRWSRPRESVRGWEPAPLVRVRHLMPGQEDSDHSLGPCLRESLERRWVGRIATSCLPHHRGLGGPPRSSRSACWWPIHGLVLGLCHSLAIQPRESQGARRASPCEPIPAGPRVPDRRPAPGPSRPLPGLPMPPDQYPTRQRERILC